MHNLKDYSYKIYDNLNENIIAEWKKLEENSSCNIFQTIDWINEWHQYIGKTYVKELFIVFIYNNNVLVSIFPLCIKKSFFVNILSCTGYPFNDLDFPLISNNFNFDKNIFLNIFKEIIAKSNIRIDLVYLQNQIENNKDSYKPNPFINFFKKKNIQNLNYYVDYSKNIEVLKRRKIRQFDKFLKFDFIFDVTDNEERKRLIKFILDNKEIQFKNNKSWNFLKIKNYKLFLENINKNTIISYIKTKDDFIVAASFGYTYRNIYYYILPVYNPIYKKISPGYNLLSLLIKNCRNKNYKFFDLTIGNEAYKVNFSNNNLKLYYCYNYYSFLGFGYYLLFILLKKYIKKSIIYPIARRIYYHLKNE
jgi:CelD/BcsL family acetyltransferase involved in cellulose biosynthesis